jgi:hypothetical protein
MSQLGVDLNSQQQVSIVAPTLSNPLIRGWWLLGISCLAAQRKEDVTYAQ